MRYPYSKAKSLATGRKSYRPILYLGKWVRIGRESRLAWHSATAAQAYGILVENCYLRLKLAQQRMANVN